MSVNSLTLKKFILDKGNFLTLIKNIKENHFNEEKEQGFEVIYESDSYFRGYYITSFMSIETSYDFKNNQLVEEKVKRYEFLEFGIDLTTKTLEIWNNKRKMTSLIDVLGILSNYNLIIDELLLNPINILYNLQKQRIDFQINKIKINDYEFFDGIIGDCVLNLVNYSDAYKIIKKYNDKIIQFTIKILLEDNYTVTLNKSGTVIVYKDVENIDKSIFDILKKSMIGVN